MGRRKRLLLISQYFPMDRGGAEYQVYCLAQHLQSQMDIHYLANSNEARQWQEGGITISTIPRRTLLRRVLGRCYVLDYFRVLEVLQRIGPDVIYVRGASAYLGIASRYVRSSPSCTLVWHIPRPGDVEPFRYRSLRSLPFDYVDKKMIEYGVRHARYIIGQAHYQEDLLQRHYGRKCDLIVGNWHPEPAQPCVKGRSVKVVWVANLKPCKKPDVFVDLAERLGTMDGVEFVMIGRPASGKSQRRLESRIHSIKSLTYLGERPIEEINRILGESHVFVNTSESEGFPNTFVQAWLREVPVVSLHVDPDDILKRQGLGFHSGSFDRLVQDTKNLIEDRSLREAMGQRARTYARKNHSLAENLRRVVQLLEQEG
jgi:glycosyltransferase involved in cell wall biosynthesis